VRLNRLPLLCAAIVLSLRLTARSGGDPFHFVILGDRTGEAQPAVYEQIWTELAAEKPAFVLSVGDTIQGLQDAAALDEWRQVEKIFGRFPSLPVYLTPGNHDIWSPLSERMFRKFARRSPHYSFDFQDLHVTVLDNSRTEQLSQEELNFLEQDLQAHMGQPVKLVVCHRPSWLLPVLFGNRDTPVHQMAKKYGVKYVVAGHLHEMLHFQLEGVTYLSMPSAGGHLRASGRYEDGWFFGHTLVEDENGKLKFQIEEARAPIGAGRVTTEADWGAAGLVNRPYGRPSQMRQSH
jgi:3',5'-cyclic-AMP phosphodiesterase